MSVPGQFEQLMGRAAHLETAENDGGPDETRGNRPKSNEIDTPRREAGSARISSPLILPTEGLNEEFADHIPGHHCLLAREPPSHPSIKRLIYTASCRSQASRLGGDEGLRAAGSRPAPWVAGRKGLGLLVEIEQRFPVCQS